LPRKAVIVYAGASHWFRRKIDSLYKGRKTFYRAKFWNLPLEIRIASLENMAENRSEKELRKIMACFEPFGRL